MTAPAAAAPGRRRYNRVRSLQDVRAVCALEGDCWLWQGHVTSGGIPYGYMDGQRAPLRRIVWLLQGGAPHAEGRIYTTTCGEPRCVNPAHVRATSRGAALAQARRSGAINELRRRQAIAATWRQRPEAKLTLELARALRSSDKSSVQLARELGLSHCTVAKVRRGESWAEIVASPWAGLGARRP